jgi:hypothetical protein
MQIEEVEFSNNMDDYTDVDPSKFYIVEEPQNNTGSNKLAQKHNTVPVMRKQNIVELIADNMDI